MKTFAIPALALLFAALFSPLAQADRAGGGGNLESSRVSQQQILHFLKTEAKINLRRALQELEYEQAQYKANGWGQGSKNVDFVLQPEKDLFGKVNQVSFLAKSNAPCFDHFGNEVDASVRGEKQDQICISLSRLAEKLSKSDYQKKITSLLFHEISHLLGADEEMALDLENALSGIRYRDFYERLTRTRDLILSVEKNLPKARKALESGDYYSASVQLEFRRSLDLASVSSEMPYRLQRRVRDDALIDRGEALCMLEKALVWKGTSLFNVDEQNRHMQTYKDIAVNTLKQALNGKDAVSSSEFYNNLAGSDLPSLDRARSTPADIKIVKVTSAEQFLQQFSLYETKLSELKHLIELGLTQDRFPVSLHADKQTGISKSCMKPDEAKSLGRGDQQGMNVCSTMKVGF